MPYISVYVTENEYQAITRLESHLQDESAPDVWGVMEEHPAQLPSLRKWLNFTELKPLAAYPAGLYQIRQDMAGPRIPKFEFDTACFALKCAKRIRQTGSGRGSVIVLLDSTPIGLLCPTCGGHAHRQELTS